MAAFHRLRIDRRHRLDGTAKLVLYHLCFRHNLQLNAAWPATAQIAAALDLHRSAVTSALRRLEKLRLIGREQGGGRGRATRYRLLFLQAHLLDPTSKQPIDWHYKPSGPPDSLKVSGPPDSFDTETVRWNDLNCPVEHTETVRPIGHEKNKTIKSPPGVVQKHAGGQARQTADDVFRAAHSQRQLALMSVASEKADAAATTDQAEPQEEENQDGAALPAGMLNVRERPG